MSATDLSSREYKVMLKAERFAGTEDDIARAAHEFWDVYSARLEAAHPNRSNGKGIRPKGDLRKIEERRVIRFYDTGARTLRRNDYVFRERVSVERFDQREAQGDREVTLKYRHPDRYVAGERDMQARHGSDSKSKFEQDVKPPFIRVYSHSTKQQLGHYEKIETLGDIGKLYPGLADELDRFEKDRRVEAVGGLTVHEIVVEGASIKLPGVEKELAECGLIVWHDAKGGGERPLVSEFSFKYKPDGHFKRNGAEIAYEAFRVLANGLSDWTESEGTTKTKFVYSR